MSLLVNRSPTTLGLSADFDEHFIEVAVPLSATSHAVGSPAIDIGRKH